MLDYKDIIIKGYVLNMSGAEIARQLGCSKSGVNDFLNAFKKCEALSFPLPEGITNYGIAELVYGKAPIAGNRDDVNGIIKIPTFGGENSPLCYAEPEDKVILKAKQKTLPRRRKILLCWR